MTSRTAIWTLASVSSLVTPIYAFAQAPAWHWSTFEKQASACACHLFAKTALGKENLNILEDSGPVLLGGNNQVIGEVVCMPDQRHITVSAFSADFTAAEIARNNIRTSIVNSNLLDTCP